MRTIRIVASTLALVALAGLANAGDEKTGAPAPMANPRADKLQAQTPTVQPKKEAPRMEMPKVPQEVTDLVKSTAGTLKCKGKAFMPDGSEMDMNGTVRSKADLENFWVHDSWSYKVMGGKMAFKLESFTTYDAALKKWRRVAVDSLGGQMTGTSDGVKDMKMDFVMNVVGPMGAVLLQEHLDRSDEKAGVKLSAERSMDQGKTWQKDYELLCKK